MKKVLAIILSLILIFSFVGCKKDTAKDYNQSKDDQVNSTSSSNTSSDNKTSSSGGTQNDSNNNSEDNIPSSITKENVKINSLDKLNFYAVKKQLRKMELYYYLIRLKNPK